MTVTSLLRALVGPSQSVGRFRAVLIDAKVVYFFRFVFLVFPTKCHKKWGKEGILSFPYFFP